MKRWLAEAWAFFRLNAAHVFSGRAAWFLVLAGGVFLLIVVLHLLGREAAFTSRKIYDLLLVPGILLVFYPAAFAIQNDKDAGMLETLFGLPDYRYKVWLARYGALYATTAGLLFTLSALCRVGLSDFPLVKMVLELMVPVLFTGSLAFFTASRTGSGPATAVILLVVLLLFWLFREPLAGSPWYLFHNPFAEGSEIQALSLAKTTVANRIYFLSGSVFLTLLALLRLQNREKLI
ncbi:MAG: hypothetical protein FJY82_08935 [Candidatus Aminicenantes bacterium]|nr:hypothetical protein [Candidatus Aminicenantes bacterium]